MIQVTGKMQDFQFEFVGQNETPKLTVLMNSNGALVPGVAIGDQALKCQALLGDPANGTCAVPGTILRMTAEQGYRFWEGNEERGPKTFATELTINSMLILGTVGPEDSRFFEQGILFGYKEETRQGNNGEYTLRTAKLLVPSFKRGEVVPYATMEVNVAQDAAQAVQTAEGQFVLLSGSVSSYTWTPKRGKNMGVEQRTVKYTAQQVAPMGMPEWVQNNIAFRLPDDAQVNPVAAPAPAAQQAIPPFDVPQPVAAQPMQHPMQQPVAQPSMAQQPVAQQPMMQQPMTQQPMQQQQFAHPQQPQQQMADPFADIPTTNGQVAAQQPAAPNPNAPIF